MKSENSSMRMENIFYHSMDPIFPPNVVEYFKIDGKENYWNNRSYALNNILNFLCSNFR